MARYTDESFEGVGYEESTSQVIGTGNSLDPNWPLEEDGDGKLPPGSGTECLQVSCPGTTTNAHANFEGSTSKTFSCGRWNVLIKSGFGWANPAAGDYLVIGTLQDTSGNIALAPIIYHNGSNYQFTVRYYDGSLKQRTASAYTFATSKWFRLEASYNSSTKQVTFQVWDVDNNSLYSDSFSFTGAARNTGRSQAGVRNGLNYTLTAEILYDLHAVDDATSPIGAEVDHTFAIATLRPTSDVLVTNWTRTGGSSNWGVLADDSDTTYLEASCISALADAFFGFTPTPGGKILAVRARLKLKAVPGGRGPRLAVRDTGGTKYGQGQGGCRLIGSYDNFGWFKWDWETNPETGKPWTWADIATWGFGFQALTNHESAGGRIPEFELQIITGSYKDRFCNVGPLCRGARTNRLGISARCARPALVGEGSAKIKVRVSPNSNLSGYEEYPGASGVTVSTFSYWTATFDIATFGGNPLAEDTAYYVDVLTSSDGTTWRSLHSDFLSYYPSYKTHPSTGNVKLCHQSDTHGETDDDLIRSVVAGSPRMVSNLGDVTGSTDGDMSSSRQSRRSVYASSEYFVENVLHKLVFEEIYDDHDFYGNNSTKFNYYESGQQLYTAAGKAGMFRTYFEWTPTHAFPAACRITGTATSTSTNKLIDTGKTFTPDNVHALATYGGAWVHNLTTDAYAVVTAIDTGQNGHQLSLDGISLPSGTNVFTAGDSYEILNGAFRSFRCGYADLFMLDLRSQRDDGQALYDSFYSCPGADMLDGVLMASPTALNTAKDSGTITSVNGDVIYVSGKSFTSTASLGDVIYNSTSHAWAQVVSIDPDGVHLTLDTQIFSAAQGFSIYESGASHGANAHGHIQRDWVTSEMAASTAEWRGVDSSVNYNKHAAQAHDQWGDPEFAYQRTYLNIAIANNKDLFYRSSNRHFAAIRHGQDTDPILNMWPELCTAEPGDATIDDDTWDGFQGAEYGTTTAGGNTTTFYDTGKTLTVNELVGFVATLSKIGQTTQARRITANTATTITVSPEWATTIGAGWSYDIRVPSYGIVELTAISATLRAYRFDGTEFSFSPFIVQATALTVSLPAYISGVYDNQVVAQLAYLAGFGALTGAQPAYAAGYGTQTGQQPAYVAGVLGLTVSQPAHVSGLGALEAAQPAYINGQATFVLASKLAFMQGYGTLLASKAAYAAGFGLLTVEQPAFVHGALSALASQPAYINGGAGLNLTVSQAAFMAGLGRLVLSLPAFLQAGFVPGGLAFQLGQEQVVFPCGRLYPVREPRERLQVVSRTAGGTLRVQDKGLSTRSVYISVNKLPEETYVALLRWYDEVAVGALVTFTFYDESGAPRQAKWIGGFGLEWQGYNRYGGEIQLEVVS